MASAQNQSANVDLFDAYFRRADLDRDGRISGNEAVAFFQGSGLPKQVLAQIWAHADQRQTGFLGRAEFYNALRLVTVAQSKRELTPEMVKAALYGPAAAKIPAPKINLAATPAPQFNSAAAAPATQGGAVTPTSSQNLGFRGPQVTPQYSSFGAAPATQGGAVTPTASQDFEFRGPQIRSQFNSAPTATQGGAVTPTSSQNLGFRGLPPSVNVNQQNFISQDGKSIRPPVPPSSSDSQPTQGAAAPGFPSGGSVGGPQPQNSSVSNDWVGGRASGSTTGIPSQVVNKWIAPSAIQDVFGQATSGPTASLPPRPQAGSGIRPPGPPTKDSKPSNISGNGFAPNSSIGVDVFSATPSHPKQNFPLGSVPVSSTIVPVSAGTQSSASPSTQVGGEPQPSQSFAKANNQVSAQTSASRVSPGAGNSASSQSHMSWPRMIQTDVQKYANIFVKVDTDRDGKITGEQAHDLFLKWGLPREVLKQVWDLSDQDNDSMLSVREFCVALYLMERFREGRPLPAVLPSNVMFDLSNIFQPANNYSNAGNIAWRPASGFQQQQPMPGPGAWHMAPPAGGRPPKPVAPSHAVERQLANQQKPRVPELEKHLVNQLSTEEVNSLNSKFKEATEADKKVEELEKEILDAREKIEYFRVKMQELAGNLASKKELLTGMRIGINLKTKDSLASRSSLLMCQMSWHLQNRNHHQFRKKKLPKLRVQQLLLHLKLMLSQKSLKVQMPRLLKMEQHMIKMRTSQQKVLRTVHLPAVLLEAHLENFQILTMERQQMQMPHPVIRNLKVMIMRVLGLYILATKVPMNQHGGRLTIMMMWTRCGVSMQLVPPRTWIWRVIRITTFLALGSSASTLSGLGHHKEVAFPKRAALLLSTILFLAHHSQPLIQGIHRQGTRIAQNLHLTPSLGMIRSEAHKILDFFLNQKHSEDLILCAAVEILIRVMVFQHLMTSQTLLALRRHLGHRWTVKLQEETRTPSDLQVHFGRHWTVKLREENQIFSGLQRRRLGHHLTVKLQEETRTHLGPLCLGHHSTVKLQEETRTHLGLQGLSGRHWRLREKTLIIGVHFS
ncbi:actin cytoskeleton-regulatory complex protein PAN1-like isoform X5 [Malus sylvestris]|uniref:actin cytoskeleton-regulatory complex protein PAN1-like isoform X5 n=1 Tax=Malus sylvestris TaxID=3752 RepID=UPI0021ABA075|nr:actin cytoskeleton-regulatory complex protein PAN1-like isoform X5 [Malus sylvestris]